MLWIHFLKNRKDVLWGESWLGSGLDVDAWVPGQVNSSAPPPDLCLSVSVLPLLSRTKGKMIFSVRTTRYRKKVTHSRLWSQRVSSENTQQNISHFLVVIIPSLGCLWEYPNPITSGEHSKEF